MIKQQNKDMDLVQTRDVSERILSSVKESQGKESARKETKPQEWMDSEKESAS